MDKRNKPLQKIKTNLQMATKFWFPIFCQSWYDAWEQWLWIFIFPLVVNVPGAILFIRKNGWGEFMSLVGSFFGYYCFGLAVTLFLIWFYFAVTSSASKYFEQKNKADRFDWNDVNVSYKEIVSLGNPIGYKIKVENNKAEMCYFFIELRYLNIDGRLENFQETNRSRMLLWVTDDDYNRQYGVGLHSEDRGKSENVGNWELFQVTENAHAQKYAITFCSYDENDVNKPRKKYAYFVKFVEGELYWRGKYVHRSIPTGGLGSGKPYIETIPGDFVYKFRIDIRDDKPTMTIFREGTFSYHVDLEEQNADGALKFES